MVSFNIRRIGVTNQASRPNSSRGAAAEPTQGPSSYLAFKASGRYFKIVKPTGAVAQLGERRVRNAEVEGSIPFRSIGLLESSWDASFSRASAAHTDVSPVSFMDKVRAKDHEFG
jgi:hypothetical protein